MDIWLYSARCAKCGKTFVCGQDNVVLGKEALTDGAALAKQFADKHPTVFCSLCGHPNTGNHLEPDRIRVLGGMPGGLKPGLSGQTEGGTRLAVLPKKAWLLLRQRGLRGAVGRAFGQDQVLHSISTLQDQVLHSISTLIVEFRQFRDLYLTSRDDLWQLSRVRWAGDEDDTRLTWGARWTGHEFIRQVTRCHHPQPTTRILEIGPGYGRMLDAIYDLELPFAKYVGVELSAQRVERLTKKYAHDSRVSFLADDVETFAMLSTFDLCISSATFSHLFPTFARAVANIHKHLEIGGMLCFDVAEGRSVGVFQEDGITYARGYNEAEIRGLFGVNFTLKDLSKVHHGTDPVRNVPVMLLFVAAERID